MEGIGSLSETNENPVKVYHNPIILMCFSRDSYADYYITIAVVDMTDPFIERMRRYRTVFKNLENKFSDLKFISLRDRDADFYTVTKDSLSELKDITDNFGWDVNKHHCQCFEWDGKKLYCPGTSLTIPQRHQEFSVGIESQVYPDGFTWTYCDVTTTYVSDEYFGI